MEERLEASFGGFDVRGTREVRPIEGETTSGVTARGRARIFQISGDGFMLEVGFVTWSTGDEDVQQLSRTEGGEPLDGLTRRLRISIKDRGDDKWMELEQARLDASGWVRSYKATLQELDEGAGVSTAEVIEGLGGEVGTREELLGDTGQRRSWMCAVFPARSVLAPVAAFTLSRIAPVQNRVEA